MLIICSIIELSYLFFNETAPKALRLYGIKEDEYEVGKPSMFDCIHKMRTRIITSPKFNGDRILGAILFEDTMNREINGVPTAKYLWEEKKIVPFLKVDKGLEAEKDDVQLMKPIPNLDMLCDTAVTNGVFGTKMRSVIKLANKEGIKQIVEQQFSLGQQIMKKGLIPILEPEIDIKSPEKAEAEALLHAELVESLKMLRKDQKLMVSKLNYFSIILRDRSKLKNIQQQFHFSYRFLVQTHSAEPRQLI